MKWFKHFSDSLDDPFVQELMDEFGHKGYTFWFGTLEIYAKESDKDLSKGINIRLIYLARKLRIRSSVVTQLLNFCATSGKLLINFQKQNVHIQIPKMLKLKDNYTQDLEAARKKLDLEEEAEEEAEKEEVIVVSKDTPTGEEIPPPKVGGLPPLVVEKKVKEIKYTKSSKEMEMCRLLVTLGIEQREKFNYPAKNNTSEETKLRSMQTWAHDFNKLFRIDKYSWVQIEAAIMFAFNGHLSYYIKSPECIRSKMQSLITNMKGFEKNSPSIPQHSFVQDNPIQAIA